MGDRTEQLRAIVLGADNGDGKRSGGMASWVRDNALTIALGLAALVGAWYVLEHRVGMLEDHSIDERLHRTHEQVAQLTTIEDNQQAFKENFERTNERQKEIQDENKEEHKAIREEIKEVERELKAGQREILKEIRRRDP